MMAFLEKWVFNIVVLTIFIVLLEMLIPSGKTRKYVKLISGFILTIALITPVLEFLGKDFDFQEFQFSSSNFIDKKEIEEKSKMMSENQMKEIIEVYRQKLIKQLESSSEKIAGKNRVEADVIINEDYTSTEFGAIKRVYIFVSKPEEDKGVKPVATVEKVDISRSEPVAGENDEVDPELKKSLEDEISRVFQVEQENIVVSLK